MSGGGLAAPFGFKGGTYPGTGGNCAATLNATATCTVVVTYNPATAGTHNDAIDLSYNDGAAAQVSSRDVSGVAVAPANLTITDGPTYNYGTLATGALADHTFTVQNTGAFQATSLTGSGLATPFTYKGGSYPGSGGTCGSSLNASNTCTVVVTYAPTAVGVHTSSMSLAYFDGAGNQTSSRGVTGTGATPAAITVSDGPNYDFGTKATGSSTDKTITLTNTGGVPATSVTGAGLSAPITFKGGSFPGTGGTCTATLAGLGSCTVVITYAPSATGAFSATMNITYNDGVTGQTSSRVVQGTGAAPASLTISDGATFDYGTLAAGGTADKSFTISNSGGVPATDMTGGGLAAPYAFKGGTYPGTGGTCAATLNASATCSVVVTYNPTAIGSHSDTIELTYTNGVSTTLTTRAVQGAAVAPALLSLSDGPTYDYGPVVENGTKDKTITVTNTGAFSATTITGGGLAAPYSFKGGSYPGSGGNCGTSLAASASCTIVVTFAPTALGATADTVEINYFDGAGNQVGQRDVQGTGAPAAILVISNGPTYDFGQRPQGSSIDKTFTVQNNGGIPAISMNGTGLAAPYTFKGGSYPGTGGTCATSLAAGASCSIVVTYSPLTAAVHNDAIEIAFNDGIAAQNSTRNLTGTGVAPATLTFADAPLYDYGTKATGGTADKIMTVTNTGSFAATSMAAPAGLSAPFSFKGGTYPGTGGNCNTTLNAGSSCTVVINYSPTATGTQTDTVVIDFYDGANAQIGSIDVQGTGAAPALLSVSDGATYDYGSVANGTHNDKSLTITNSGGVPATAMAGSGLSAPFAFKGGTYPGTGGTCSTSLSASATCTIVVTFSPTSTATHNGSVTIAYNNGVNAQSTARALTGTSSAPASLSISHGPTFDFLARANGSSHDQTFTVTNGGAFPASAMAGSGLSAPYSFKGGTYPGAGGSCGLTLAGGATCSIVVNFSPTSAGTHNGQVDITYNTGAAGDVASRAMTGTSTGPAILAINLGPTYNFGTKATGSSTDRSFIVSNTGAYAASGMGGSGLAAPFTFKGGTYPGTGGSCTTTLAAGSSCTVIVTYAPTATGTETGTFTISYNNGASAQTATRDVTGTGAAPATLAISDGATYDYGTRATGSSIDKSFTISNSGGVSATAMAGGGIGSPYAFKGGTYPGTGGTCNTVLAASGSCTIVVTYSPLVSGVTNSTITISYNDGAANQNSSRAITGTGAAPASLTISNGPTYNFGAKANGSVSEMTFTITNSGSFPSSTMTGSGLAAPYAFKNGSYPGSGGTCSTTLNPAATCTIIVTFSPTATATHNDTIEINYNDGVGSVMASGDVTGTSSAPATLAVSDGPNYDFGTKATGSTSDKTLTISNSGGYAASSIALTGLSAPINYKGGSYPGTGGDCGTTLAASGSCTIVVTYAPTATGSHQRTVNVGYNDGVTTQSATRQLDGTGAAPALVTVSDGATYDYGAVANGTNNDKTFTLTNSGGVPATSLTGGGLAAPFSFKGGGYPGTGGTCSTSLAASATCTVVVTYAPTATGSHSDAIDLTYNDGVTGQSSSRAVQGSSSAPATLTISDGPTYDFGARANGSSHDYAFTVQNTGAFTATAMAASGLSAPYTFKGGTYPGTGGNCGLTLAGSATCTIVVNFSPTFTATHNGTMLLSYNSGAGTPTASRAVTGTSTPPAVLAISDGPTYDFTTKATGSSTDKTLTISNTGSFTASSLSGGGLAAPFTFKGGSFPGTGGNCTATLNASNSCTVVVTYAPTATGVQTDTFDLSYNNGVNTQSTSRDLQGTGAAPALLGFSDGPLFDYGTKASGSTTDKTLTITNSGGVPSTGMSGSGLAAPFSFKGGGYPGTGGTCAATLIATQSCTVVVVYNPSAAGTHTDTVDLAYSNGVSAQNASRDIQGTAVAPANLTITDGPTYDYGPVVSTGSADKTFTIQNTGALAAATVNGTGLAAPFSFKGGSYPGTGGSCGTTVNAGATCTVVVTFNPTATGPFSDALDMTYFDGANNQTSSRSIQGTGATPASITISDGTTYNFGTRAQGSSTDKTLTLTNGGGVPATSIGGSGLAAPYSFKDGSFPGTGGNCTTTLVAGSSCTVVVTYAPTTVATHNDTLDITYNNGLVGQTSSRALTGTGTTPASLTMSDGPAYDFGTKATGSVNEKTITVTNGGGFAASSIVGSGLAAPFLFKGGTYPGTGGSCTTSLPSAGTCTIVVTWSPTATGAQSDTIDLAYYNGAASTNSTRDLTGTGAAPALITLSDGATYNYGSVANTTNNDKSFTLTNSGGVPATAISGGGLAAPYAFKGGTFPGSGGSCTATLSASATCTVVVTFSPTTSGTHNDAIEITYNDGAANQQSDRNITGTSSAPASLAISDATTYNYGARANGSSHDHAFTVTNNGAFTASSITGSGLAAPYSFKGGSYPGTGGDCSLTLAGSTSCTIVVTFAPTADGTHNSTIQINYNSGAAATNSTRGVTGTSTAPAVIAISDASLYDSGTKATGSSTDKALTLTNTGAYAASSVGGSGLAAPFTFKGGAYPGTGGTCTTTINAGDNCTVIVTYAPTATGTQTDTMDIGYHNGVGVQTSSRDVQGTGAAPANLSISDSPTYDYGTKATGSNTDKTFTVSNAGGVPATAISGGGLASPFAFKGGTFPGTGGSCTATLNAAASCTVVVTFTPTAAGSVNDTLEIAYTDGVTGQLATRDLTGAGVAPALITISHGATFDYSARANGSSTDQTFTLTNTGTLTATTMTGSGLAAPYTFKGGSYPGSGGTCGATLAGTNTTCTIVVTFAPTADGTHTDQIEINYNNGASNQMSTRDLTGSSTAPATITISDGATYNYGTKATGSSTDKSLTITNTGGYVASSLVINGLAAPYTFKDGTFPGTGGSCGASLNAGTSCTVVVTWAPTATGAQSDSLDVAYNDGVTTQSISRPMTGTGAAPASITISESGTYDYGSKATGSTTDKSFTITNTGGVPATSMSGGGLAAPFGFKGGSYPGTAGGGDCTSTLAAGASCTVVVTYAPTTVAVHSDALDVTFHNGVVGGQTSSRGVTGTGVAPALLTITDGPTFDFGPVVATASVDKTFTIQNTGSLQATSVGGTGLAAPFSFKGGSYPGSGGNCGTTLNASATCTIVVTFNPSTTGPFSDTIDMGYNNGVSVQTSSRDIQGTGATPASITISDGATYNFGSRANGSSTDKTLTLTNGGGVPATSMAGSGLAAPYSFKGGSFPGTGGTCVTQLNAAQSCTVVVTYNPTVLGTLGDSVDIDFHNGLTTTSSSRALTGTSVAPATITISDATTYDYGTLATGATVDKTFTLTNTGTFAAGTVGGTGLAAPFTFKGGSFPGTGGSCTSTLNGSNATCTIVVTYAPTATGSQSDSIEITYFDGAANQTSTRGVTGTGAAPALLTVSETGTYDYGSVANSSVNDKSFTITNSGGVTATSISGGGLATPFSFKNGTFPGTGGNCTATLGSGASCTIVVTFAPTSTGTHTDTIEVDYNDGASLAQTTRPVTGQSSPPATLVISDGSTYNFGAKANGSTTEKTFTVQNTGSFTATSITGTGLAAPYTFKGGSYPGLGGNCSTTLAASGSCTIVTVYAPTVTGTHSDTIDINYNNGVASGQLSQRDLTGTSAPPAVLAFAEAPTYNYGTRATGSTLDRTFTLTNSGGIAATSVAFGGFAAPFNYKGGTFPGTGGTCGTTLNASNSCTLVFTYSPTGTGAHNDAIDVTYDDGITSAQTTSVNVTGTGASPALITITDTNPYDYGSIANGGSADRSFTLTNTGGVNATSLSGTGLAAPYSFKGGTFPGSGGGNCTTTLAPAATCTVVVTFAPTVAGVHNDTLDITYANGVASGQTSSRDLTGTGMAPASLTINNGPTFNYGAVVTGNSLDQTFTIQNTGSLQATAINMTGLAAPFTFKGGSYPGNGGDCGTTLAAAGTCTVVVTFNPSTTGSFNDTLDIAYHNGASAQSVSRDMQGVGATPASLTISDGTTYDYNTQAQGSNTDKTFTITNGVGVPATSITGAGLAAPFSFKGGVYPGGGTCTATISNGASCTIIVTYSPTATGTLSDTIEINYNTGAGTSQATRGVTGTAVAPALLTISGSGTYNYGLIANGATAEASFTVTNSGSFAASAVDGTGLAAPFAFKGGTYPGSGGNCSTTLGVSASCTIVVTYSPGSTGTQNDTIEMNYNDGAGLQQATRALTGQAAAPAAISISESPIYDYGTVATTSFKDRTFTISNTGGVAATSLSGGGLALPYRFKGGSYPGTGTCTGTLSAGGSCTIIVTYAPTSSGTHTDSVEITFNNGVSAGQLASRDLTGVGATPALLTINRGPSYDYGVLASTGSADQTFTITNSGGMQATSLAVTGLAAPFAFAGGSYPGSGGNCGTSLNAAATCTIVVTFNPTSTGAFSDQIEVAYNDAATAQSFTRDIQGTGATAALLTVSDGATFNYGTKAQGSSSDKTFTITNSGGVPATALAGSGLAAPYSFKGSSFPGTGGTCSDGGSIAAASSCTIVVTYAPTSVATHNDTIDIGYHNGLVTQASSRDVTGTAISPASLTISDGATYDFGTKYVNETAEKIFTVTNNGSFAASTLSGSGLSAPYSFKDGSFPGTGGSCTATLSGGASCSFVVKYAPTSANTYFGTISLPYNDGANAQTATRAVAAAATMPIPPGTPGTPTYSITEFSKLTISWTASTTGEGPISYSLYRSAGNNTSYTLLQGGITAPLNYTDTTVTPGTTYYYKVRAVGLAATTDGAESSAVPMGAFAITTATAGDRSVSLVWGASSGASNYQVRYGVTTGSYPNIATSSAVGTGYTVTGLTAGSTYYFTVDSKNTWGTVQTNGAEFSAVPKAVPARLVKATRPDSACVVLTNGDLKCWGRAVYGMLGNGSESQVGDDADEVGDDVLPAKLSTSVTATTVYTSSYSEHFCAIMSDNTVRCWGRNLYGQLGLGDTNNRGDQATEMDNSLPAVSLGTGLTPTKLALGENHTCALFSNGSVKCWGLNNQGQLGQGNGTTRGDNANEMGDFLATVNLGTSKTAKDIAAFRNGNCVILNDDTVKCWGRADNNVGQLGVAQNNTNIGDSSAEMGDSLATVNLGTGLTAKKIAAGGQTVCVILNDNTVKCWGLNSSGQLGQDNTTNQGYAANDVRNLTPVNLGSGRTAKEISVGATHSCAILDNDTVKCWGDNTAGALGHNVNAPTNQGDAGGEMAALPTTVVTGTGGVFATSISAGFQQTCAKLSDNTAKCWGSNGFGQLGFGDNSGVYANIGDANGEGATNLVPISLGTGKTASVVVSGRQNNVILRNDGKIVVFGDNNYGRLGLGQPAHTGDDTGEMGTGLTKVNVGTGLLVSKVAMGLQHTCAIMTTGQMKCWGRNNYGQLGLGDIQNRNEESEMGDALPFVDLGTGRTAKEVTAGNYHTCAILDNDSVKCWGYNWTGQLGYGNTTTRGNAASQMGDNLTTVSLGSGRTAKDIVSAAEAVCALLDNNTVKCWGRSNGGQLGKGNTNALGDGAGEMGDSLTALSLGTGRTAKAITAGNQHFCAILDNDTLKCWGEGSNGRLGTDDQNHRGDNAGEMGDSLNAINLGSGRTAKKVAAGSSHTCAILDDNTMKCFGAGGNGRLGYNNGTTYGDNGGEMAALTAIGFPTGIYPKEVVGLSATTCAIFSDDTVRCWGYNSLGTAGIESVVSPNDNIGDGGTEMQNLGITRVWDATQ